MTETARARVRAPALPTNLEWFNVAQPLKLEELKGRVVILDFWTYCCINCMHVLPDLRYLERKYPETLVVIGLHTPKFLNEKVASQVQKAINRYDIQHPVAHDPGFQVWREYGVRAWPSLVVIDTEGYVVGMLPGEGHRQRLDTLVAELQQQGRERGSLKPTPAPLRIRPENCGTLCFPGKLAVSEHGIAISDSAHHRVLLTDHGGNIRQVYGIGEAAMLDGSAQEAALRQPQGLLWVDKQLYVADTGNHALRRIDVTEETVTTIAGTGEQGRRVGSYFEQALQASLSSPWDLAYRQGRLYIAMAGPHQIWQMELSTGVIQVYAGSGREALTDGAVLESAYAQPSGLSLLQDQLYVADSETSAIRRIDLMQGQVTTLVGKGLFEFGDKDGLGGNVRLQHPLGVAADPVRNVLWIADSYNHKIKQLDINSNMVSSIDLGLELMEPGGLALYGDSLWIANTNLHQVLRVDLENLKAEVVQHYE